MQAIITKTLQVTNTKGLRVKASCEAGNITLSWDYAHNADVNHRLAAEALCAKLEWDYMLVSGSDGDKSYHIPMYDSMAEQGNNNCRKYRSNEIERVNNSIGNDTKATMKIACGDKSTRYLNISGKELGALIALFNQNDAN